MEPKLKIAMVMDDYKLKNKEEWWAKCLKQKPAIEKFYVLDKEETVSGPTKNTTTAIRHYKLKENL